YTILCRTHSSHLFPYTTLFRSLLKDTRNFAKKTFFLFSVLARGVYDRSGLRSGRRRWKRLLPAQTKYPGEEPAHPSPLIAGLVWLRSSDECRAISLGARRGCQQIGLLI